MTKETYNWKNYKVLVTGSFHSGEMQVKLVSKVPKTNDVIRKSVEYNWQAMVKGRKSVGKKTWDSVVYYLSDAKVREGILYLELGETSFKNNHGMTWLLRDIYGKDFFVKALITRAVVFTSDNKIVLGKRNTGVKKEFEQSALFGGSMDKDETVVKNSDDVFSACRLELRQELGIKDSNIKDIFINSIFEDWTYHSVLLFHVFLDVNSSELESIFRKGGNKGENSEIGFYKNDEIHSFVAEKQERYTDLALVAMDLLGP